MKEPLREATLVWIASIAITGFLGALGLFIGFVADNLLAFVAATFLYLPAWVLWRRGVDLADYGLRTTPVASGLVHFALVTLIVMPPFYLGHHYWQQILFEQTPHLERERLVRFSQDLDHRPELPISTGDLHVWHEGQRLMVLWTGERVCEIKLRVRTGEGVDPVRLLRGFKQDQERAALIPDGLAGARVSHEGVITWKRKTPGGFGFSSLGVESLTLETNVETVRLGRYSVAESPPLEAARSAWWWLWMFVTQLILVAIPEEWFYRGYLQQRLDEALPARWRIFGADLGWGWLLSSVMFALGHLILDLRPERLAVFFPSLLFGWMKARTGSIMAPTLFHALSNVSIQTLGYIYL